MSDLLQHAKKELDIIGMTENGDEYNTMMRNAILEIVEIFSKQEHSGFSANYAINLIEKLLRYEPLSPLTGEDSEWNEVRDNLLQNNRLSSVFKKIDTGYVYDIDGKVFIEHYRDAEGNESRCSYTSLDSRVAVEFPYTKKTEYVDLGFVDD